MSLGSSAKITCAVNINTSGANYFRDMGRCHTHTQTASGISAAVVCPSEREILFSGVTRGAQRDAAAASARVAAVPVGLNWCSEESGGLPHWLISPGRFWPRLRAHIDAN
jgi:hypothetical protein